MNLIFANLWMLYLLWLVPLLLAAVIAGLRSRERRIASFVSPVMQKRLRPTSDLNRQIWQGILMAGGILLCMIALARPQWGRSEQRVFRKGRDVVIALDVSRSMLANDVHPNRLERAKIDIMDLLNEIEGDRTALLAFRHKAIALCPLTTDYAFLRHILDMSGIHSAPLGETDIGDAIDKSVEMLIEDDSSHKAILLISDGEDLTGRAVEAAEKAAARGIPIFTVGFGRASGSSIPDTESGSTLKYKGEEVISRLNNDTLYKIAKTSGGAYIPIQTASTADTTLGNIYQDHFSKIAARELEETITSNYAERFHYFLLPGIILLLSACFFSKGRLAGSSQRKPPPVPALKNMNPAKAGITNLIIIFTVLVPCLCLAATNVTDSIETDLPEGREAARRAQRLFDTGQFSEAAELYLRAAATITGPAKESFTYNAAVSLYKEGKHSEAVDLLDTISGEGSIPLDRLDMALGTAHYQAAESIADTNEVRRLERVAQAIEASAEHFAEAARLNTDTYAEALRNTAASMEKLPAAREEAHKQSLLEAHSSTDAFELIDTMLTDQRDIVGRAAEAFMKDDPSQIQLLEELAKKQETTADLWIPLQTKLNDAAAASTNQISTAALEKMAEDLSTAMQQSARSMKDLDTSGYHTSAMAEDGIYRLWKGVAPVSKLLGEDLRRQSNAVSKAASRTERIREQKEASELTKLFRQRFEQTYPKDAPAPPPGAEEDETALTPENREKIIALADAAQSMQEQAEEALASDNDIAALDRQTTAKDKLNEIEKLLPKQKKKQDQQDQQQNKQDQEDDQKNEDPDDQQEAPPDQQAQDQDQNKGEDTKDEPKEDPDEKQEATDDDVERLLEKALQREKEHETEKRRRHEYTPPTMIERDW